jgi:hypothetical protein
MLTKDEKKLKSLLTDARLIALDIRDQGFEPEEIVLASLLSQLTDAAKGILSELARKTVPVDHEALDEEPENQWANYPQPTGASDEKPKPKRINLLDYLDSPELVRHVDGRLVKSIGHQSCGGVTGSPVCVGFKGGVYEWYPKSTKQFVLIEPKMVEPIPETGTPKKKPDKVQVPVDILDYVDRPELVRHVNGRLIESIACKPEDNDGFPILVRFKNERYKQTPSPTWYPKDTKKFVLINPGTRVVGWRRKVLFKNGNIMATALFMPSKEAFNEAWKGYKTFGEWEKIDELIEE